MAQPYTIRPARPADLDRLVALQLALQDHLEASNPHLWRMLAEARDQLRGQLAARLAAPGACVLVAEHPQDGVIGVLYGRVVTNTRYTPSRAGTIDQVYVQPDHRRRGVATRLVAALCAFFERERVDDVSLRYVAGNDEAAAFWTALGFAARIVTVGISLADLQARLP